MSQELYTYIQELHLFVQYQNKRIDALEKAVQSLTVDLKEMKERPPVQVGTIEYKFDQLKVETLEGTLNIGINPSDLEGIENFEVDNQEISADQMSPKERMEVTMDLENSIHQYLDNNLRPLIKRFENQNNTKIDEPYIDFIEGDIKKQLPNRIDHYLKFMPFKERNHESNNKLVEQIEKQLIKDIENAVYTFLRNIPKTEKDG